MITVFIVGLYVRAGIGKSLFLAYFFLRCIAEEENANATVIVAAYGERADIMEAAVRQKNGCHSTRSYAQAMQTLMGKAEMQAKREGRPVIFLYDGAPPHPPRGVQFVCFTSPKQAWLKTVKKNFQHIALYVPLWEESELLTAVEELELIAQATDNARTESTVDSATIVRRFEVFGGVARECLARDAIWVKIQEHDLKTTIGWIHTADDLTALQRNANQEMAYHQLMHFVPVDTEPWRHEVRIASQFVSRSLMEMLGASQYLMTTTLDRFPATPVSLQGLLLEARAHKASGEAQGDAQESVV